MERMKNEKVITRFINGYTEGKNHSENLRIEGNKLYNYSTCIAKNENGKIMISNRKYSQTTSTHQNRIRREAPSNLLVEVEHEILN